MVVENRHTGEEKPLAKIRRPTRSRQRLSELKETLQGDTPNKESWFPGTTTANEGTNLNQFLASLVGRKTRKKHQLQQIKEFFENPLKYGVDIHDSDTSSTDKEINQRKIDLQYRINLLKALLDAAESELHFLEQAKRKRST
jgi:hypothetical protein